MLANGRIALLLIAVAAENERGPPSLVAPDQCKSQDENS
jgi:hypothetical protein